jgi:PAS domain S-box-containing protein
MNDFFLKALGKLDKLDPDTIRALVGVLHQENVKLHTVLDSMVTGVIVTDTDHKVILHNKAAGRCIPYTKEEIEDHLVWEIIADPEIAGFVRESIESQSPLFEKDFTLEGEGKNRTFLLKVSPLVHEGSIAGDIVHIEDVTAKRSEQARLRRAESLAALTTLAAGVAHEIKNPLGSISIHLQLIQKILKNKSAVTETDVGHNLTVISEEVDRLNRIVVDFLFAVRPMNVELVEKDINDVLKDVIRLMEPELTDARIACEEDLCLECDTALIDEKLMKQAVLNIAKNAMSAMPDGGTLTFRTRSDKDGLNITVSDTGTGIPEEIREKIFEPYFTTKEFGSGLGLTLVYKIIKEHKGDITLQTAVGKGTSFIIHLPVVQKERRLLGYKEEAR